MGIQPADLIRVRPKPPQGGSGVPRGMLVASGALTTNEVTQLKYKWTEAVRKCADIDVAAHTLGLHYHTLAIKCQWCKSTLQETTQCKHCDGPN